MTEPTSKIISTTLIWLTCTDEQKNKIFPVLRDELLQKGLLEYLVELGGSYGDFESPIIFYLHKRATDTQLPYVEVQDHQGKPIYQATFDLEKIPEEVQRVVDVVKDYREKK